MPAAAIGHCSLCNGRVYKERRDLPTVNRDGTSHHHSQPWHIVHAVPFNDALAEQQLVVAMVAVWRCCQTFKDQPEAAMLEGASRELGLAVDAVIERRGW